MKIKYVLMAAFLLILAFLTAGCSSGNGDQSESNLTTAGTEKSVDTSADTQSPITTAASSDSVPPETTGADTSSDDTAEKEEYDYSLAVSFCNVLQSGSALIDSVKEFCVSYGGIMNITDSDNIENDFAYAIKVSTDYDTQDQIRTALSNAYSSFEAMEYDENLLPLLKNSVDSYEQLYSIVYEPSGTYGEYIAAYNDAYDKFVFDYDEIVAYLYAVGVYTE